MAQFLKGDIVLSPFPFSGEEEFKSRPALVLASLPYGSGTDYLLCIITTQSAPDPYLIALDNADMESGRLSQDCHLRPAYTYTVSEHLIKRRLGRIKANKLDAVIGILVLLLTA